MNDPMSQEDFELACAKCEGVKVSTVKAWRKSTGGYSNEKIDDMYLGYSLATVALEKQKAITRRVSAESNRLFDEKAVLIKQLEAAERERDELKRNQELNLKIKQAMHERFTRAEAELARRDAAAGEAIGEIRLGDYDSDGIRPASVVCLHEQADWENFPDGTKLYTRAEPTLSRDHFEDAISLISRGYADISHHAVDSERYADDQTQVFWENYLHSKEAIKCQK